MTDKQIKTDFLLSISECDNLCYTDWYIATSQGHLVRHVSAICEFEGHMAIGWRSVLDTSLVLADLDTGSWRVVKSTTQ